MLQQALVAMPPLLPELGTRYFKSNDDIGTENSLKSTAGTDNGTFF